MATPEISPARRRFSIMLGIWVVTLLGFLHLMLLLTGMENGSWITWTTPFAFWGIAFLSYKRDLKGKADDA